MTIIFIEGFDKYGPPVNSGLAGPPDNLFAIPLMAGEWTSNDNVETCSIVSPLTGTGGAMRLAGNSNGGVHKTMAANYPAAVGGCWIMNGGQTTDFVRFYDGGTLQATIGINSTGTIYVKAGGTVVGTSSVSAGTAPHCIEWSIPITSPGNFSIYMDGALILTGSGNFKVSANSYWNALELVYSNGIVSTIDFDHLYIDDGTGTPLLTQPLVETHFMSSDGSVAFANTASIFGAAGMSGSTASAPGANTLFLRRFQAPAGGATLNSVSCRPSATSSTANFKAVVYADSSGSIGALLATGTQMTGSVAGSVMTGPFSSGQALTGGAFYWIGFITDTSVTLYLSDASANGYSAANTYTSGAPATPTLSSGKPDWMLWGNLTGVNNNTFAVSQNPTPGYQGDYSYTSSNTLGAEDLFNVQALNETPAAIYTVFVKGYIKLAVPAARTVSLRTNSAGSDSGGALAPVNPTTSYAWYGSAFATDPATGVPWTAAGLNAALAGYEINT